MSELPVINNVDPSEKGQAVEILTAAFYDYPAMRFFMREEQEDYGRKLRLLVDFFCEARLWKDWPPLVVRVRDKPVAAALVNPPVSSGLSAELQKALEVLKREVGTAVMDNLLAYENTCERMEPETPHYYLGMIGVLPGHQGSGYARLLLDYLHDAADKDPVATGVCLNTENPRNVSLYRHLGYEVIGQEDVGPLHTWSMFRPSN